MFWDTLELNFRVALGHDGKMNSLSVPTSDAPIGASEVGAERFEEL